MSPARFPKVEKLVKHGAVMDKFNIVVLGDGFQEADLPVFDEYADLIAVRLLKVKPFDSVAHRINVWKVSTVSTDSGVTFPGAPKNTFYGVEGNWQDVLFPGYFGTPHPDRIIAASALAVPEEAAQVRILIVNYDFDGGRGSHADRTVFIPLYRADQDGPVPATQRKRDFVLVTAHECGHAMADLAEEYVSCNVHTLGERHPNQQTPEELVLSPTVKWTHLAHSRELNALGRFKAVHEVGDRMTLGKDEPKAPIVAPAFTGMLGLYWGCMDIDPSLPIATPPLPGECDEIDPRAAPFHRPMARCRMRYQEHEFCRVCADALKTIILDTTG